jgi:hypothetical protein
MNISTRLAKIEEKLSLNNAGSEFCACYEKHWRSEIEAAYNDNADIEIEIYPKPDFEKGFCDRCKSPISSHDIEYNKNLEEIYGEID